MPQPLGNRRVSARTHCTVHTCHLLCWLAAEEIASGDMSLLRSQIAYVYVGNVNITLYCLVLKRETVSSLGITQISVRSPLHKFVCIYLWKCEWGRLGCSQRVLQLKKIRTVRSG